MKCKKVKIIKPLKNQMRAHNYRISFRQTHKKHCKRFSVDNAINYCILKNNKKKR